MGSLGGKCGVVLIGVLAGCADESRDGSSGGADGTSSGIVSAGGLDRGTAGAAGGTAGINPEGHDGCAEVEVAADPVTPLIVMLVDQSSSMEQDFGGQDRWDAVYEALMDEDAGIVTALEDQVWFGLSLYSSEQGDEGGACPMLTEVAPALGNRDAMDDVFRAARTIDDTPTGDSLSAVADKLAQTDFDGPKVIVLATDGEPDTCEQPDPNEGQAESLAAAAKAYDLGIKTHIISVGDDIGEQHLAEMANVGVGRAPNAPNQATYYRANDPEQLVNALAQIVGTVVSCELVIQGEVDLEHKCSGTVVLDGEVLECGVDYDVSDPTTLVILGDACDTLKDGQPHSLSASFPCDVVDIP